MDIYGFFNIYDSVIFKKPSKDIVIDLVGDEIADCKENYSLFGQGNFYKYLPLNQISFLPNKRIT